MKSIMISVKPQTVARILNGEQTTLIAKSTPKETPFKVYVYETLGNVKGKEKYPAPWNNDEPTWFYWHEGKGKVVAEFVCNKVSTIDFAYGGVKEELERELQGSCLTNQEARDYFLTSKGSTRKNLKLYGGHITDLKIYEQPKELGEFKVMRKRSYYAIPYDANSYMKIDRLEKITRPPRSWQYVEGEK